MIKNIITPLLIALLFSSLHGEESNLNASIELLRGYNASTEEHYIEHTLSLDTKINNIILMFENTLYGTGSVNSQNLDEVNTSIGYNLSDWLTLSLFHRFLITDDNGASIDNYSGGIITLVYEDAILFQNENELSISYANKQWEYVNTLLIEKHLAEFSSYTVSCGLENELLLSQSSDAINATTLFFSGTYKTLGISIGYVLESAEELTHASQVAISLSL